jgi:integrase
VGVAGEPPRFVPSAGLARTCASSFAGSLPMRVFGFAPHQLRHAHAVELAREGVPLNVIQRQLGHANLGTTSIYLEGIDTEEIIATAPPGAHR